MDTRESSFEYTAHTSSGGTRKGTVQAADEAEAYQKAARSGLTVTRLARLRHSTNPIRSVVSRKIQIDLLRQFCVMVDARVDAAQALASMRSGAANPMIGTALDEAAALLRSGETLGNCLRIGIPGLSANSLALIDAGERGGCLAETLSHAVLQLEAEERISASFKESMIYPLFLMCAGIIAGILMLTMVVPRFALLLGEERASLTGLSWLVFALGDIASQSFGLILVAPILLVASFLLRSFRYHPRKGSGLLLQHVPVVAKLQLCRERESWCRIMSFALSSRIEITEAVTLASAGIAQTHIRDQAKNVVRSLRLGSNVADAVAQLQLLDETHLSLVRVGEKSGVLPDMFRKISQDAEIELQGRVRKAVIALEQCITVAVSGFIGLIVYGLISSLTVVYEVIGQ